LGAYQAYLAYAETAGLKPVTIDNYIEYAVPNFIGSYTTGSPSKAVRDHPDTFYYYQLDNGTSFSRRLFYLPEDLSKLSYRVFMGGDYPSLDYTSTNKNGNTLIVIKDSYANAFIPWVSANYEYIIVIDPRQYESSVRKFMDGATGAVDVLFVNSALTPSLPTFVDKLAIILGNADAP
jgi:hypothetical protein